MKKSILALSLLLLVSCGDGISSSSSSSTTDRNSSPSHSTSSGESNGSSTSNEQSSVDNSSLSDTCQSYNPDGSCHLRAPLNMNAKLDISGNGANATKLDFTSSLPSNVSYIYGHKILTNESYYAGGGIKFSSNTLARQGIQSPAFVSNLKLEIRIGIGEMHSNTNKVNEEKPVFTIYGFDDSGKIIQTALVEKVDMGDQNHEITRYINGTNISYLEIRATNLPWKGSQCYNFAFKSLTLIAWPYPL